MSLWITVLALVLVPWPAAGSSGMLYPQESESREIKDLSGVWSFKVDTENVGMQNEWWNGTLPSPTIPMPVPASFNDITQDEATRKHIGWVWYETYFRVPSSWQGKRVVLRFESAHYYAVAWINGEQAVTHDGGHLPFECDASTLVSYGGREANRLTVAINNTLTPFTLPPGEITIYNNTSQYPDGYTVQTTYFDFFNYAGIHRPVYLYTTPNSYVDDVTVNYELLNGGDALVLYNVSVLPAPPANFKASLYDQDGNLVAESNNLIGNLTVPANSVKLWEPGNAYLYSLTLESNEGTSDYDVYTLKNVGIRTIQVTSTQFLINGKPFYFHGVDKHEDSDIRGKGLDHATLVKDINMMNWMHVNAFRTSHYPYSEEYYQMADQNGIVIIGECPAVGLAKANFFSDQTLAHHKQVMFEMIRRDKNHPSVVMWNVANEPASDLPVAKDYFKEVSEYTKAIDPTNRPVTLVQDVDYTGQTCAEFFDVVCINRYYGWYSDSGELGLIERQLSADIEGWYQKYNKPIIISEYGADTVPGVLSNPSMMFSEHFQVDFMQQYHNVFDQFIGKYLIGELVWNFADFATDYSTIRVGGFNMKGVLTRQRQPKPAAYKLRDRYKKLGEKWNSKNGVQFT